MSQMSDPISHSSSYSESVMLPFPPPPPPPAPPASLRAMLDLALLAFPFPAERGDGTPFAAAPSSSRMARSRLDERRREFFRRRRRCSACPADLEDSWQRRAEGNTRSFSGVDKGWSWPSGREVQSSDTGDGSKIAALNPHSITIQRFRETEVSSAEKAGGS